MGTLDQPPQTRAGLAAIVLGLMLFSCGLLIGQLFPGRGPMRPEPAGAPDSGPAPATGICACQPMPMSTLALDGGLLCCDEVAFICRLNCQRR